MTDARLSSDPSIVDRADILVAPVFASPDGPLLASAQQFNGTVWENRIVALLRRDRLFTGEAG